MVDKNQSSLPRSLSLEQLESRLCLTEIGFAPVSVGPGGQSLVVADVDDDGDSDIILGSRSRKKVGWYENMDGQGSFSEENVIATHDGIPGTSRWLDTGDLDRDGDIDVLVASLGDNGGIFWYENIDGQGNFSEENIIAEKAETGLLESVFSADLDSDGDLDVLIANSWGIAWHENTNGRGVFSQQKLIAMPTDGRAESAFAADVDGDGDMDVLSAFGVSTPDAICFFACPLGRLSWYEQLTVAPGDANGDFRFDQDDILHVMQTEKYLSGQRATFQEGDWNGDFIFDQMDIVAALQTGNYLQGPYAQ